MLLPKIQGNFAQTGFFIYVACDTQYFDDFAVNLINSVKKNTAHGVHLHIFNPRKDQLDRFFDDDRVSVTYEEVKISNFEQAATNLKKLSEKFDEKFKYERSLTAMKKGNDRSLLERMLKTYYACARFVRLGEILTKPYNFFAIDVDAVVRKEILPLTGDFDFFIHHISGKKSRFLAGGMLLRENQQSLNYIKEYSEVLKSHIEADHLYWSLDQDVLDNIVPKYRYGILPISYIDWNMSYNSCVWTAKGERKNLSVFIDEKNQYSA